MPTSLLLDHAASTPVRPEALAAFLDATRRVAGGNPSAGHGTGRAARQVLEEAREQVGAALGRSPHEVVFTSGGTEADQLGVVGTWRAAARHGRTHVVCAAVEHPAVRDALGWLAEHEGAAVTWVAPEGVRPVEPAALLAAVRDDTALVVCTAADGELGLVQDVTCVVEGAAARGVPVHVDAVQRVATGSLPPHGSLAVSGHKLGAPVGIGAAALPRAVPVRPVVPGPGQERGLRSGTQPAALASALAAALTGAVARRQEHAARSRELTCALAGALAATPGVRPSVAPDDPSRLPTHLHLQVDGVDGEALALALDAAGVHASTGTACATGSASPSPVLAACGVVADATLRCSVGAGTTATEVAEAARRIDEVVRRLRADGGGFL